MKTILVPTDFSKASLNAIEYAVEIVKHTKSKIMLFHVFKVPVVSAEVPTIIPLDEIEADSMAALKKIEKNIHKNHSNKIRIECVCACGFPIEEINLFAEKNEIDLIIMGIEGTGYLAEKIIGSTTTSLMRSGQYPVMAIDKHAKFKRIERIALACDYNEIKNKSILEPLKELAHIFKSHIHVFNVLREMEPVTTIDRAVVGIHLHHILEDVNHSFHYIKNEDIIEGINDFVNEHKIDLIVMIPRMHSVLKNIFQEPTTKRMAFHTKTPLLALHE